MPPRQMTTNGAVSLAPTAVRVVTYIPVGGGPAISRNLPNESAMENFLANTPMQELVSVR